MQRLLLTSILLAGVMSLVLMAKKPRPQASETPATQASSDSELDEMLPPPTAPEQDFLPASAALVSPELPPERVVAVPRKPKNPELKDALTATEESEWRAMLPSTESLRAEIDEDPHAAPRSLRALAPTFGRLMQEARLSPEDARKSFRKFQICAQNRESVTSLKVTCFTNAKALSKMFPKELSKELDTLEDNLDSKTRAGAEAYSAL